MEKMWYDDPITDVDVKDIKGFLASVGIKLVYKCLSMEIDGEVDAEYHIIYVNKSVGHTQRSFISTVFHEMYHCICYDLDIYSTYHKLFPETPSEIRLFRASAYRAERYVDRKAQELMAIYFPDIEYTYGYRTKADKKWFHITYLNKYFPKQKAVR